MITVHLSGTPEKIGESRAEKLKTSILLVIEYLFYHHDRNLGKCVEWANQWKAEAEKEFPELCAEMRATGKKLGIDEDTMFAFNFRAWNALTDHPSHLACYNIFFLDPVEGPILGGIVEDAPHFYVLEKIVPEKGYPFYSITMAGTVWTVRGFNAEGLAVGQVSAFPGEPIRKTTFAFGTQDYARSYFVLKTVLQHAGDVQEGVEMLENFSCQGTFMLADSKGEVRVVEKAGKLTGIRTCEGKFAVSGGHFLCKEIVTALLKEGILHIPPRESVKREHAIARLVEKGISLELMKEILTSHREEDGKFCNDFTQFATIAIPSKRKFLVAGYTPCQRGFESYTF